MRYLLLMVLATVLVSGGCSDIPANIDGGNTDSDSDTDTDVDTDTDTDTDSEQFEIEPFTPVTTADLEGMWGFSGSDIWAVGAQGAILHFDGTTWDQIEAGFDATLQAVWGASPDDVWAVGTTIDVEGIILHYDGESWEEAHQTGSPLVAVGGSGANDVYAIGMGPPQHWNGAEWTEVDMTGASAYEYSDVWACDADNVYIIDLDGVHYFDGTSWTTIAQGWISSQAALDAWGQSPDDLYVAVQGGVVRWDGEAWGDAVDVPDTMMSAIFGSGDTIVSIGVSYAEESEGDIAVVLFDGEAWIEVDTGGAAMPHGDVWAVSESEYFFIGEAGGIARMIIAP